jgi:hypothetical protein
VASVIFSGPKVKALKNALQLGNRTTIWSDNINPKVSGFDANVGDVFISTLTKQVYQKFGSGNTDWVLLSQEVIGDITSTEFTALDNQPTPQEVTGLSFNNADVRSFKLIISIDRNTLLEQVTINAIQKSSEWDYSIIRVGDDTGINFTISNSGQVEYTSTPLGSTAALNFRAFVTKV